ncbi:BadF-type ATPase [Zhouia amylolytica]|uniref:N-acetylglucosamine kinase-like protein n=2 Tax=Zhouia amylolytica TaxID=376730 RepID=W2UQB6_9FLAO|nr:BadF/BadG/BcrA/BcrD ATPase family protein [Zhouia amylolytica]ETN96193.1 N-acetylglucosamine kinase-like protein [Zhouia amylolytica AD3]MCQ0112304.1 N-acetylglucosamine kinase [Zhouia amylolytica]SFT13942.1 BadF-type ATPase [Zhouia amylolytica]
MILIVDSGATKADWIALDETGEQLFTTQTLGLSPEVLTKEIIVERITNNFDIYKNRKMVTNLFFYGAGCGTERMRNFMKDIFQEFFLNGEISVKEDTYAAIYATTKPGEKAVVCILGTGSNCSYWDGDDILQKVDSLGYILMDDCSGNYFGRQLLRDYYYNKIPADLARLFSENYDLDSDTIKNHLYKQPNPNTYLATFAKFLIQNKENDYAQRLIAKGMQLFVDNWISQYEQAKDVPVHFVGSISYYLKDELKKVLEANNLRMGNVLRRPIDGLVSYHRDNI